MTRQVSAWNFRWQFSGGGSIPAEVRLGAPQLTPDGTLLLDYSTDEVGAGRWRLRGDTLEPVALLPAAPPALPVELLQLRSPGLEVQTVVSRAGGRRYVLRWETLPRNRDLPRAGAPPAGELRLYELPDTATDAAMRVGS